jgi:hypothetical protein
MAHSLSFTLRGKLKIVSLTGIYEIFLYPVPLKVPCSHGTTGIAEVCAIVEHRRPGSAILKAISSLLPCAL